MTHDSHLQGDSTAITGAASTASVTSIDPLALLTTRQVAARTGLSLEKLMRDRKNGVGIPCCKLGRSVRYRAAAWKFSELLRADQA